MALRSNRVIILSDTEQHCDDQRHRCISMQKYMDSANKFERIFKHYSKDQKYARKTYELQCFKRWYILRDYMKVNDIPKVSGYYFMIDSVIDVIVGIFR